MDPPAPFVRTAPGQVRTAQAANCTRPYWIWWYAQNGMVCNPAWRRIPQPPYSVIQSDVNDGYSYYDALQVNLTGQLGNRLNIWRVIPGRIRSTMSIRTLPSQNPNDPNFTGRRRMPDAIFDQRHRLVFSGVWVARGDCISAG